MDGDRRYLVAIHARQVSCREVMVACLAESVTNALQCIVSRVDSDLLLRQADVCDQELGQAPIGAECTGFPLAVKVSAPSPGALVKGSRRCATTCRP
jgi:amidase